ncbi:ArsR family transcriptional regulator [Halothiobacillus diazotrophicus]|uniref:ArsR family transcriptional regulator n=1 Tax=Halothiobacillus diazotrophicus TaxID=1860122 RepID=A0A191ZHE2_9GAMM|nr:metalloregulator ArsR/SmtB family transcription factor [Halothiobacillus diazotrophicus]ANJ67285.1 ArsR family transcriptional regulator [Halothiobacillus diazotrophicus]
MGFKQQLNDQFARLGMALSNGPRLEILEYLAQTERSVDQLATLTGHSAANTSRHLQRLHQVGLVTSRRQGKQIFYRLADDDVVELLAVLKRVAERHLHEVRDLIQSHLTQRDSLEPLSADELIARCRDGLVTVLDVRPPEEYEAGHIPGAINITLADLERRIAELDPKQEIVAYCRGAYCALSFEAIAQLRANGFQARRLADGFPEWKHELHPVAYGPNPG